MPTINKSLFDRTVTSQFDGRLLDEEVISFVESRYQRWSTDRQILESDWKACWAEYLSNARAADQIRSEAMNIIGDARVDWRHKITTGKAFELVEDANSYLQNAFFPNKQWFDAYPKEPLSDPEWEELLRVLQKFIQYKMDEGRFSDWWDINCRQTLIIGTSVLALPWRYDSKTTLKNRQKKGVDGKKKTLAVKEKKVVYNGLDFEVVNMFDFFLDPRAINPVDANCIRRYQKTRGELIDLIESGVFSFGDADKIRDRGDKSTVPTTSTSNKDDKQFMQTGTTESDISDLDEMLDIVEFWGDMCLDTSDYKDVCVTVCLGERMLLDFKPNPFWAGKPFVITTLINSQDSPYGIGLLQPILGQLHQLFSTMNHRLDCSELVINPMWKVVNDGTLDLNSLFSEPAKIIPVGDMASIEQIVFDAGTLGVSVQDEQLLEQRLERVTGITPYVGQGQGRDAERVTAEEVKSKRDAGGNRLGRYHKHIEETALKEVLYKVYSFMQQFVLDDEVIRMKKPTDQAQDAYEFIKVGAEELETDLDIVPVGSDWVIDKEREVRERIDFITLVSQHPVMSEMVNWSEVMKDLARRLVKQDWDKYLKLDATPPQTTLPVDNASVPTQSEAPPTLPPEATAIPEVAIPLEQRMAQGAPPDSQMAIQEAATNPELLNRLVNGQ